MLKSFLLENIQRLKETSPKFWKMWGRINIALIFFGGVPTGLNWLQTEFSFDFSSILPMNSPWILVALKICAIMGMWGKFMTALSVQSNHEIVSDNGTLIQKPCDNLPFTSEKEATKLIEPKDISTDKKM